MQRYAHFSNYTNPCTKKCSLHTHFSKICTFLLHFRSFRTGYRADRGCKIAGTRRRTCQATALFSLHFDSVITYESHTNHILMFCLSYALTIGLLYGLVLCTLSIQHCALCSWSSLYILEKSCTFAGCFANRHLCIVRQQYLQHHTQYPYYIIIHTFI